MSATRIVFTPACVLCGDWLDAGAQDLCPRCQEERDRQEREEQRFWEQSEDDPK